MKIVLLGSGNVATHLGLTLKQVGNDVLQVWSRKWEHAEALGLELGAGFTDKLADINPSADIYIISVVDDAIAEVAGALTDKKGIIIHTSGSSGMEVLQGASEKTGIIYPLQTFSKQKPVDFSQVPVAIEGNTPEVTKILEKLVSQITSIVLKIDSVQRQALHVAAVFACNFTNHLYALSKKILDQNKLSFDLLKPLISETADKVQKFDPKTVQTGPAVRHDQITLNKHRQFLKKNPHLLELYDKLSQSIINS